jgi:hypothetical protein
VPRWTTPSGREFWRTPGGQFTSAPAAAVPDTGIGIQGRVEAQRMLLYISGRLEQMEAGAPGVFAVLNRYFEVKWRNWAGYLVETGDLRDSWTDDNAPGAIREAQGEVLEFGSDVEYSRFHVPAILGGRPQRLNEEIAEVYAEYLVPHSGGDGLRPSGSSGTALSLRKLLEDDDNG